MAVTTIASIAYAASGQSIVELSKMPFRGPGGSVAYLRSLIFKLDITDVDTGAGGVVTVEEFNDLLAGVDVSAGAGGYYGPRALSGADLQALRAYLTGEPLMYCETEGDRELAASQSNAIRQIVWEFPYWAIGGGESDFCPPVEWLANAGGRITIRFSALPTNATAVTGTLTIQAVTEERPELVAVPLMTAERQGIDSLTAGSLGRGRLIASLIKNVGDWADGDIDGLTLWADGIPLLNDADVEVFLSQHHYGLNEGADDDELRYAHGFFPIDGGGDPRFIPVYPMRVNSRSGSLKISKRAVANSFTYTIRGAETAANMTWITVRSHGLAVPLTADQMVAVTHLDRPRIEAALLAKEYSYKTLSKQPLGRESLAAHLPVKMQNNDILAAAGIITA